MALTDTAIKNAKPKDRPYKLMDEKGLYMIVNPNGSRWWRLKYHYESKEKLLALGTYPEVSLAKARDRRAKAREQIADGIDPSAAKKEEKQANQAAAANSFQAVALEYMGIKKEWSEDYAFNVRRRFELDLFPNLGSKPIHEIKPRDVLHTVKKIEGRGATETSHRVLALCGQVFKYAMAMGMADRDPTAGQQKALQRHKSEPMRSVGIKDLPALLRAIETYDGDTQTRLGLRLLALTFVRTIELRGAEWSEIDFDDAIWVVPAKRMKMKTEHVVPLAPKRWRRCKNFAS